MQSNSAKTCPTKQHLGRLVLKHLRNCAAILAVLTIFVMFAGIRGSDADPLLFEPLGDRTSTPTGWAQFCATYDGECDTRPSTPRDIVLSPGAWSDLVRVNEWVNRTIAPMTDMDHYGMIQWWRFDDGIGACHSYALLKRRMLIEAGWPREALVMTIVRTDLGRGEGHAVLTAKTDQGEFILDNLTDDILLWSRKPYVYYKRQSQSDPNAWIRINDPNASLILPAIRPR
jgi:predicted transglutaminase-like cysteine proteinase